MKTMHQLQILGDAVVTLRRLQTYCHPYATGTTRPSDSAIVEAIDIVLKELNAQASETDTTSADS